MQKLSTFRNVFSTLQDAIELYREFEMLSMDKPTEKNGKIFLGMRDSMIKRFAYCTDLFWKVLKIYLEEIGKVTLPTYTPAGIIREAVQVKVLTEQEGSECLEMIKNRNQTSHIYYTAIVEDIAEKIPEYYRLMNVIVSRLKKLGAY